MSRRNPRGRKRPRHIISKKAQREFTTLMEDLAELGLVGPSAAVQALAAETAWNMTGPPRRMPRSGSRPQLHPLEELAFGFEDLTIDELARGAVGEVWFQGDHHEEAIGTFLSHGWEKAETLVAEQQILRDPLSRNEAVVTWGELMAGPFTQVVIEAVPF